jgi:hypothetical protein
MPLLIPYLPSNFQVVLKIIYDIASLKLIPKQYISGLFNWFYGLFKISGNASDSPYIDDLGDFLFGLTIFGFIALVLIIFGVLFKKVEK